MRKILLLFYIICITGCTFSQSRKDLHILIPMNYTGWVNMLFNATNSNYEPFTFDNGYVFFITKSPNNFLIKTDIFSPGKYNMNYYYYNDTNLIKLSSLGYPNRNIFFEEKIQNSKMGKSTIIYSFYVSKIPIGIDTLSKNKLPENLDVK